MWSFNCPNGTKYDSDENFSSLTLATVLFQVFLRLFFKMKIVWQLFRRLKSFFSLKNKSIRHLNRLDSSYNCGDMKNLASGSLSDKLRHKLGGSLVRKTKSQLTISNEKNKNNNNNKERKVILRTAFLRLKTCKLFSQ